MKNLNSGEILTDYVLLGSKFYAMKVEKSKKNVNELKQKLILEE